MKAKPMYQYKKDYFYFKTRKCSKQETCIRVSQIGWWNKYC